MSDDRPVIIDDEVLHNVHPVSACMNTWCAIHNPSDHPLASAPLNWRGDRDLLERICPHGIGHPDPDSLAYVNRALREDPGVHGCDGCCRSKR